MYTELNSKLEKLQQDIYRCQKNDSMLGNLNKQLLEQQKKKAYLENELKKENLDFERLNNKMSVTSIFYTVLGSKEKQIEKERQEAVSARLRLEDINYQIADTNRQIELLQAERRVIDGAKQEYDELFQKKYHMMKQNYNQNTDNIIEIENKLAFYKSDLKEINEAMSVGHSVIQSLSKVRQSLDSAEGWGTWDMLGGGFLATMAKHGHIDDARNAVSEVQMMLNRFRTELADVHMSTSISIEIDGFVKFADYFFDGLISDWVVQSRIHDSQMSVRKVEEEVRSVLSRLSTMKESNMAQVSFLENELSQVVLMHR